MYDIHNHLIFDVDDGAKSIEESILMIEQMIESGFKGAITTSHYDKGRYVVEAKVIKEKISILRDELLRRNIDFKLYPGNEVQIDEMTIGDLEAGKIMTMNESKYVLSELPMIAIPHYAKNIFYEMQLSGYVPIIAHPERYIYIQKDLEILVDYIRSGCLVQMNLNSLTNDCSETAKEMVNRNMVHFVGTDAHSSKWRNGKVGEELIVLREMVGEEKFNLLTKINPRKIIDNDFVSGNVEEIVEEEKKTDNKKVKKKWYKFWR